MSGPLLFVEARDAQSRRAVHQIAALHEQRVELVLGDARNGPCMALLPSCDLGSSQSARSAEIAPATAYLCLHNSGR